MNNYITFDGKKYMTVHRKWTPAPYRPRNIRQTSAGNLDATFGPAVFYVWKGEIIAPVTPADASWGTPSDLRASMLKDQILVMIDHYGTTYNVAVTGGGDENSHSPMWDAASNRINFSIELKGAAA